MEIIELMLLPGWPVGLALIVLVALLLATGRGRLTPSGDEPVMPSERARHFSPFDDHARLRVVAIERNDRLLFLDGLVDATGHGVEAPVGAPVTFEVRTPESFWLELSIEQVMAAWVADNRVIDVAVLDCPAGSVASFSSAGSVINLPLVGGIALGS